MTTNKRMMWCAATALSLVGVGLVAPAALAAAPTDVSIVLSDTVSGTIKAIEAKNNTFTLTTAEGELSIRLDDKTEYMIDGKKASRDEALKVGARAKITWNKESRLASQVAITTAP